MIYNLMLRQTRLLLWALNSVQGAELQRERVCCCSKKDQAAAYSLGLGGKAWGGSVFIQSSGETGNLGRERTRQDSCKNRHAKCFHALDRMGGSWERPGDRPCFTSCNTLESTRLRYFFL